MSAIQKKRKKNKNILHFSFPKHFCYLMGAKKNAKSIFYCINPLSPDSPQKTLSHSKKEVKVHRGLSKGQGCQQKKSKRLFLIASSFLLRVISMQIFSSFLLGKEQKGIAYIFVFNEPFHALGDSTSWEDYQPWNSYL